MPLAGTENSSRQLEIEVEFDESVQSVDALEAAAYRLIGLATCQIERRAGHLVCVLSRQSEAGPFRLDGAEALRAHFLNLVTDENLRLRLSKKTDGVRDVILALAFGALAGKESD